MSQFFSSVGSFLGTVIWRKWVGALLTLQALAGLYIQLSPADWPLRSSFSLVPMTVFIILALLLLLVSAGVAFHEQRIRIGQLEAKNIPNITGKVTGVISIYQKDISHILMAAFIEVTNTGEQTSLDDWCAYIDMPDGTRRSVTVHLYPGNNTWQFRDGGYLMIDKHDQIQNVTSQVIPRGGNAGGVLPCGVDGHDLQEFSGATLIVSCTDAWGQTTSLPFIFVDADIKQGVGMTRPGYKASSFVYGLPRDDAGRVLVQDKRVLLGDIFRDRNSVSGYIFERCQIIGPGVIQCGPHVRLERPVFSLWTGNLEDYLIVPDGQSRHNVDWTCIFSDTVFRECSFVHVAFFSLTEDFTDFFLGRTENIRTQDKEKETDKESEV